MIPVKFNYKILDSRELWSISTAGTNIAYRLGVIFVCKYNYKARFEQQMFSSSQGFG